MDDRLSSWINLVDIKGLSSSVLLRLNQQYPLADLPLLSDLELQGLGLKPAQIAQLKHPNQKIIDKCARWLDGCRTRHIISIIDPHYPYLLKQISGAPALLFVEGSLNALIAPQMAIVGSRSASTQGLDAAYEFGYQLAKSVSVCSGLALGVDGRAHRGALDAQGTTVAVLGSGLDCVYPAPHKALARDIIEHGALVSEFWPWTPPRANFFPKRNRIISGLSTGVLVIEAAARSGSLITARLALEQGRDVFALPSSIQNTYAAGSNGLIKQGAFLVDCVDDILQQIGILADCSVKQRSQLNQPQYSQQQLPFADLLANVGCEARCVDLLAELCDQPVHEIMMQLLELELEGLVSAVPGGYIRTRS